MSNTLDLSNYPVCKKDLKFILTINVIGLAGILALALFANDSVLQKVYIVGTMISVCGFILSCIDFAKEKKIN